MASVKDRLILGIGLQVIDRPRELQRAAGTDEHNVVHILYRLQKQGLVEYRRARNIDSPGINLKGIHLTPKGLARFEELKHDTT
jgi:DNA-binding MarR family transcriptional regulator